MGLAYFIWQLTPDIISLGALNIRWYSVFFMGAFMVGYYIGIVIYKIENKPQPQLDILVLYLFFSMLGGARLGHCLFYDPVFYFHNPIEILYIWKGGLASHGALIMMPLAIAHFGKSRPTQSFYWVIDRLVFIIAMVAFFIRLGNFFNSEAVGIPSDLPWAVQFIHYDGQPRHPSQLYEAFFYLAVFVVMGLYYIKRNYWLRKGENLGMFLILIFGFRFFVEYVKEADEFYDFILFSLNKGQVLSIPAVLIGLWLVFRARSQSKTGPSEKITTSES
ncbi:MAG: prolipoprotein diacylglyceryl transferase [Cytophagales bacterium]|nr:MAG: prolipoprotein diacylglyceryl transferase [Cytophagales bacterium]TAF59936.1 MAG: prolipoprotein diacylglyceryl transferase [Cytophagales bacterium]